MFPKIPREVAQQFAQLRDAVQQQKFQSAASALGTLIDQLGDDDYCVINPESRIVAGFRSELLRFMSALDQRIWDHFEQLRGEQAKRLLNDAAGTRDVQQLQTCAQRWCFTSAGREAILLLARLDLDRGQPSLAIRRLSSLDSAPDLQRFEPERSILLATALGRAGRTAESKQVLAGLNKDQIGIQVRLGDNEVSLSVDRQIIEDLALPASPSKSEAAPGSDWLSYRGNVNQSAKTTPGTKYSIGWKLPLIKDERPLSQWRGLVAQPSTPLAPILSPLGIGKQLVARSLDGIYGVSTSDGRLLWTYPPRFRQRAEESASQDGFNAQRLWHDGTFGRLSSDGRRIFFIDALEFAEYPGRVARIRAMAILGQPVSNKPHHNVLIALDMMRDGAFAWMVDRVTIPSEPEPVKAHFLGPPLPVNGELYAIAEAKGQVRVVALSPESGEQLWSLPLAQLESPTIDEDPTLRFAGIAPAYQDGILICPTYAGAVVAIDILERRIKWGYQYRDGPTRMRTDPFAFPGIPADSERSRAARWHDRDLLIIGSSLIIACENDDFTCLELDTGTLRWIRRREDTMYLANIGDDRVLLVGEHRLAAIRVHDGAYLWPQAEFVAIPGGGSPAGRGFFDGKHFHLPTSDPELIAVNVQDGTIIKRQRLGQKLGNLIAMDEMILSQDETTLTALVTNDPRHSSEPAAQQLPDVSASTLSQLIEVLAAPDDLQRESASQELLHRENAAIPFLDHGARSRDPEVAFRCATVLLGLLDSADVHVVDQARAALVGSFSARATHRFAAHAMEHEIEVRVDKARAALKQLGATITSDGKSVRLPPSWTGGNDGLTHLFWLPQLESLELRHSSVEDTGVSYLRNLSNLRSVNLNRSMVTSAGLRHLVGLSKLETLLLQGTSIDDSAIEFLGQMRHLKSANLSNTQCSPEGIETLRRLLPECKILY